MSKVRTLLGAIALTATLPFSAAAQDGGRDFQVPARFFQPGALPGVTSQAVPIYCKQDFDTSSNPPRPTAALLERIDTIGFGGGAQGNVAFLFNTGNRENFINALTQNGAKKQYRDLAADYDNAPDQLQFLMNMLEQNHEWNYSRYSEIAANCRALGKF